MPNWKCFCFLNILCGRGLQMRSLLRRPLEKHSIWSPTCFMGQNNPQPSVRGWMQLSLIHDISSPSSTLYRNEKLYSIWLWTRITHFKGILYFTKIIYLPSFPAKAVTFFCGTLLYIIYTLLHTYTHTKSMGANIFSDVDFHCMDTKVFTNFLICVPQIQTKFIQIWNEMRVRKWWQHFHVWVSPFKFPLNKSFFHECSAQRLSKDTS